LTENRDAVEDLARRRLPQDIAERWMTLLRPAARLRPVQSATESIVGQLGGTPSLPETTPWPEWSGQGPLSFIASIDCKAVQSLGLDIVLPRDGRLAFFYFDGQSNNFETFVLHEDPSSAQGCRVIYTPESTLAVPRACPNGLEPYPKLDLAADSIVTYPNWEHPVLTKAFRRQGETDREFLDHPINSDAFYQELWELESGPRHQVGGYAAPVQGPVENEAAQLALGGKIKWDSPALAEEAGRWRLLAQIDNDDEAKMMWGDVGTLYWLMPPHDLIEQRFDAAGFTWQCH